MQSPNSADAVGDMPTTPEPTPAALEPGTASMHAERRPASWNKRNALAFGAVLAFVAWTLVARLARYGIWDPWELETADAARVGLKLAADAQHHALGAWLVAAGFRAFGVHEWAGRLPIALCGVLCALTAFQLARRYHDTRAGLYAALIAATCPLLVFNARTMLGAAPDMLVSGALGLCLVQAVLPADAAPPERAWR